MRLLVNSRFHPSVGGVETVASILAHEWTAAGVSVSVVTDVSCSKEQGVVFPFPVYHRPKAGVFLRLLHQHDIFLHFNVSLRALWPWLIVPRPLIVSHQSCYFVNRAGDRDWRENLKLWFAQRAAANIAASHAIAGKTGISCNIIPNPFDSTLFHCNGLGVRSRELVFVGRLVSDKGADLLLKALRILKGRRLQPQLTVIGDGPERPRLDELVHELNLEGQVSFSGIKTQREVAELLREHHVLVVPSLWEEPFGVVALEGIASGCVVVGAEGGGLPEAIGPCGLTFPNGDANALAKKLEQLLMNDQLARTLSSQTEDHLAKHHASRVAKQYLEVIRRTIA
jgi:glycosyltransferase involved in cell wall biosynthesis